MKNLSKKSKIQKDPKKNKNTPNIEKTPQIQKSGKEPTRRNSSPGGKGFMP